MTDTLPSSPMFTDAWGANYRLVEPGEFVMGDVHGAGAPSEQPTHTVQITEPFFLVSGLLRKPIGPMLWVRTLPNFKRVGVQAYVLLNKSVLTMSRRF